MPSFAHPIALHVYVLIDGDIRRWTIEPHFYRGAALSPRIFCPLGRSCQEATCRNAISHRYGIRVDRRQITDLGNIRPVH